ncbi:MAG: Sir2 family NAD-dependent protein deacetylase [Acidobacteriota bacterium]
MSSKEFAALLTRAQKTLFFTGAGMSTGSGIPDFRGPKGLWKRMRPIYFNEFMASHEARVRHWQYKLEGWREFRDALPSRAHKALFEMDQMGLLDSLVTQNIDGLHQLAGHSEDKVTELHGTNRKVECVACQVLVDPNPLFEQFAESGMPPVCPCGGFLKSATVSFGQAMPQDKLEQAFLAAGNADLVVSVGSTLEVEPAASIPRSAKDHGATYVVVNQGPTAHDGVADLRIEDDLNALLPATVDALRALNGK